MRKILLLCAATITTGIVSCSKENHTANNIETPSPLVGDWEYTYVTRATTYHDGIHTNDTHIYSGLGSGDYGNMYFRSDGTGTIQFFIYEAPDYVPLEVTWDLKDDTLNYYWIDALALYLPPGHLPMLYLTADSFAFTQYRQGANREFHYTYHYTRM